MEVTNVWGNSWVWVNCGQPTVSVYILVYVFFPVIRGWGVISHSTSKQDMAFTFLHHTESFMVVIEGNRCRCDRFHINERVRLSVERVTCYKSLEHLSNWPTYNINYRSQHSGNWHVSWLLQVGLSVVPFPGHDPIQPLMLRREALDTIFIVVCISCQELNPSLSISGQTQ